MEERRQFHTLYVPKPRQQLLMPADTPHLDVIARTEVFEASGVERAHGNEE